MRNFTIICLFLGASASAQNGTAKVSGQVTAEGLAVPFASVYVKGGTNGTNTDENGRYQLELSVGKVTLVAQSQGYKTLSKTLSISANEGQIVDFVLEESNAVLDEIVVTGTRTEKRRTDSPVIVNLINSETLEQVVATDLSEGLRFQPGLRVEMNCQTCNYSQIRMNGLQGGYSQILINGRPIFSPLTGLYGLEQIPVNMIERIEVVRGGVSALYGSSAIGGTVNVITKIPKQNGYSFSYAYQNINGGADQSLINGNATVVSKDYKSGANFFVNTRTRTAYDANGDNFSELPELKDNSFGINAFYLPTENSKLEVSFSSLYEYRFGGEIVEKPAYLTQQSEERDHHVLMGSLDYQINFNEDKSALILYYGGQRTDRDHYTGIIPDDETEKNAFFADPPYGVSDVITHQGGLQYNHKLDAFLGGTTVLTAGAEYLYDDVFDEITAYDYEIDQTTRNLGVFFQNDWEVTESFNFLAGFRVDKHNLVDHAIVSPRVSLLYKLEETTQFRLGWGTGFRAPQAFDTDLHIAFAGGGVSRISLAENLEEERSNSFTASVNYDKATEHFIAGFTLEGFYTHLNDAFYQFPLGEDAFGERFEKRNGSGATVKGITLEARANFDYVVELAAGFTLQSSLYDDAVENIEGLELKREFLRTPNDYGYATLTYTPTKKLTASANLIYTGKMDIIHFAGEGTGQDVDEYDVTPTFTELSLRVGYTFNLPKVSTNIELFGGVKNVTNSYQADFDTGKNRDSNYIYGPAAPRTVFVGLKLDSL
ncbi:TonB-dependent receptor [Subsaximicrobium wynnwilliamsii]|uniref:TonB-dependent receptor n=1 Tax=Subsaximicrobium wynnwilliamsii TaxID=291179 RepID=A0A5C6ZHF5_9FLAO|nr:TonB-dependent receptor [Subsaximicrobium wynnwilliamsii]TXD83851.1 TonB-dependent receptor [Subsaximicrobium wynnwilliamsii]TXD89592.1 TonB-dependent receptor [Subsaximicrobium wynnwilliamsii]TXE02617.1 TonB-dependent receptor [Subsaximicrobium wynnwilliamsii]